MALTAMEKRVAFLYITDNGVDYERVFELIGATQTERRDILKTWATNELATGRFSKLEADVIERRALLEAARDAQ